MPRIGLEMELPLPIETANKTPISWQGLGPFENYPDRLAAARFGLHKQTLDQMHTPYIFPTDSGLRCGTKNLNVVSDRDRRRFFIQCESVQPATINGC